MTGTKTIKARIEGRVQGVSYRAWTQVEAKNRDLAGWVRNEADGNVTALLSGPDHAVDDMVRHLDHGPPAAVVKSVETAPADPPEGNGFEIRH